MGKSIVTMVMEALESDHIRVERGMPGRRMPDIQEAVKTAVSGDIATYRMESTYYDTPAGDLSQMRCTLRRRFENEKTVYTLKMPATQGRAEFEVEADDLGPALEELCKLIRFPKPELLDTRKLIAVCGAAFIRTAITTEAVGSTVEIALDAGVLTGGGKALPLCEIEVELKSGSPEAAVAYASELAQQYSLIPEPQSKFRRAYLLAGGK